MRFTIKIKIKNKKIEIVEYAGIVIFVVFLLSSIGLYHFLKYLCEFIIKIFTCGNCEGHISSLQLIATLVAGTWALILYYQKIRSDKNKFLKIYLETKSENEFVTVSTRLHNETSNVRKIEMAFLIINKSSYLKIEDTHAYLEKVNKYFRTSFTSSEHLKSLVKFDSYKSKDKEFHFIQLPYYTNENIQISNEDLTFEYSFPMNDLQSGIYDVRFFIYPTDDEFPNLERIVHKNLIIKNIK